MTQSTRRVSEMPCRDTYSQRLRPIRIRRREINLMPDSVHP